MIRSHYHPPKASRSPPVVSGLWTTSSFATFSCGGIVGINADERSNQQDVVINVTMSVDLAPAAASDDIAGRGQLSHRRQGDHRSRRARFPMLVERLAEEIAALCLATDARIVEVKVDVEKPGALRFAESVGVSIHRTRSTP